MPWGRLDDKANDNPKLRLLSDPAWRMWGCGVIYCQAHLTDGFIPAGMIHEFGVKAKNREAVAEELCRALIPGKGPLWEKADGGYQMHDYLDWNPPKERILADREKAEERLNRHKERRKNGVANAVLNVAVNVFQSAHGSGLEHLSATTYHSTEEQERAVARTQSLNAVEIRMARRARSRETTDGKPPVRVIAALARHILSESPDLDEGELMERVKRACARANLEYAGVVGHAIDRARAQLAKRQPRELVG